MRIAELLSRRTDLGTFLVHLTRLFDDVTGKERLKTILATGSVEAKNAYGHAKSMLTDAIELTSQRVVCFTETPLEHLHLLTLPIDGRQFAFEPYGFAFTKRMGRSRGVNPVWYIDITPGHDWLTIPLNQMITDAQKVGNFQDSNIAKLTPFIEQMGAQDGNYRKEFSWEREWRHRGDFRLPSKLIGICPSADIEEMSQHAQQYHRNVVWIDPSFGLEEIIGKLAGFAATDVGVPE